MTNLARHNNNFPNITININIEPADLIVYADEKLITQVVLNLLKNAMQAIGSGQPDGLIALKAYCNPDESVIIEAVSYTHLQCETCSLTVEVGIQSRLNTVDIMFVDHRFHLIVGKVVDLADL